MSVVRGGSKIVVFDTYSRLTSLAAQTQVCFRKRFQPLRCYGLTAIIAQAIGSYLKLV
jgi:hypothetical protein